MSTGAASTGFEGASSRFDVLGHITYAAMSIFWAFQRAEQPAGGVTLRRFLLYTKCPSQG